MNNEEFDENDLSNFILPESFLQQLFDFSGSTDGNRGFLLVLNQDGSPMIYTKSDNEIVQMGLRKALEKYIIQSEESEFYNKGNDPLS